MKCVLSSGWQWVEVHTCVTTLRRLRQYDHGQKASGDYRVGLRLAWIT